MVHIMKEKYTLLVPMSNFTGTVAKVYISLSLIVFQTLEFIENMQEGEKVLIFTGRKITYAVIPPGLYRRGVYICTTAKCCYIMCVDVSPCWMLSECLMSPFLPHHNQCLSCIYVPAELMMWPVTSPCVASKFSLSMETGGYVAYTCVPPVR